MKLDKSLDIDFINDNIDLFCEQMKVTQDFHNNCKFILSMESKVTTSLLRSENVHQNVNPIVSEIIHELNVIPSIQSTPLTVSYLFVVIIN